MYTDPESGITISSNGSSAAESFMSTFNNICKDSAALKEQQKSYIYNKYGFVYFVTPNGWIDKCKQKENDSFEGILEDYRNAIPELGELLCVGWLGDECSQEFVIYKITEIEQRNQFFDLPPMIYGSEIEEFDLEGVL